MVACWASVRSPFAIRIMVRFPLGLELGIAWQRSGELRGKASLSWNLFRCQAKIFMRDIQPLAGKAFCEYQVLSGSAGFVCNRGGSVTQSPSTQKTWHRRF